MLNWYFMFMNDGKIVHHFLLLSSLVEKFCTSLSTIFIKCLGSWGWKFVSRLALLMEPLCVLWCIWKVLNKRIF